MRNCTGTPTSPPLSPSASLLRKGGVHRPSSSDAGGEARDSAQSVSFPSLLGGAGLVVRSVSCVGQPHSGVVPGQMTVQKGLSERGGDANGSCNRGGAAGAAGNGGGWAGEGHASLLLRTRTVDMEATRWQGRTHCPLSFPVPKHPDSSRGASIAHTTVQSTPPSACHREV